MCRKRSFATCGQGPRRSLTAVSKRFRVASRPRALRCSDGLRRYLCREASADGPDKPAYACCRGSARERCCPKSLCGRRNGAIGQHSTARAAAKGVSRVAVVPKPVHRGRGTATLPVPGRSKRKSWLKGPVVLLQEAFDVGVVNAEVIADIRHLCRLRLECFFRHYAAAEDTRGRDDERIRDWLAA